MGPDDSQKLLSSLPLQILLYFNRWYSALYVLCYAILFIYKGLRFPYPPTSTFTWEVLFLFFYAAIEAIRLFLASKGNKTEQITPLIWSVIMAAPIALCNLYYFQFQVYVLRFDVVLNAISLSLLMVEATLTAFTCIVFYRANRF